MATVWEREWDLVISVSDYSKLGSHFPNEGDEDDPFTRAHGQATLNQLIIAPIVGIDARRP